MAESYKSKELYRLKKPFQLQDGNSIDINVDLKKVEEDSDGYIKLETIGEHKVKRVFWAKKDDLKKLKNEIKFK
jgi:hypothetical protein